MRMSAKAKYGILALIEIEHEGRKGKALAAQQIAQKYGLSAKFLEQVLSLLKLKNIIKSEKGRQGGYRLAKPAKDIMLSEILNYLEPSILESEQESEDFDESFILTEIYNPININLKSTMNSISLFEICLKYDENYLSKPENYLFFANI